MEPPTSLPSVTVHLQVSFKAELEKPLFSFLVQCSPSKLLDKCFKVLEVEKPSLLNYILIEKLVTLLSAEILFAEFGRMTLTMQSHSAEISFCRIQSIDLKTCKDDKCFYFMMQSTGVQL